MLATCDLCRMPGTQRSVLSSYRVTIEDIVLSTECYPEHECSSSLTQDDIDVSSLHIAFRHRLRRKAPILPQFRFLLST